MMQGHAGWQHPPCCEGQAHQDRLYPAGSLEPEGSAAVIDQVVLHIQPSPHLLPLLLLGCALVVLVLLYQGAGSCPPQRLKPSELNAMICKITLRL